MSESDDTDLLLSIPPDIFVVRSDSEDSMQSCLRRSSDHRFQELVGQVNELRERIHFTESKDNESFSEANRFNQSIDYSVSFDASNYHNVHSRDVALSFYSLASAGISFGCDNDNVTVQCWEPCVLSSSGSNTHNPNKMFSPVQESKFERSVNENAIYTVPSSCQCVNSSHAASYSASSSAIADEVHAAYGIPHSSEPINFDFLNEIDEFLEKRDKCSNQKLHFNEPFDDEGLGKLNSGKTVVPGKSEHCKNVHPTLMKLAARDTNQLKGVIQLEEVTSIECEVKLEQMLSDINIPSVPCSVLADESSMEKCSHNFIDNHNEKKGKCMKEGSKNEYSCMELKSKVNKSSLPNSSFANFVKDNSLEFTGKQATPVSSTLCSLPRQSPYVTRSPSSCDSSECKNLKRCITSNGDVGNNVYGCSIKNCASPENEKNYHQFENQNCSVLNRDSQSTSYGNKFSLPIHKNKTLDYYFHDKCLNFPMTSNVLHHPSTFVCFQETTTEPKYGERIFSRGTSSSTDMTSNIAPVTEKLKNHHVSELRNYANCELSPISVVSDDYIDAGRLHHNVKKEISSEFLNSSVAKALSSGAKETHDASKELFISDYQADNVTLKPPKNQVVPEHILNSDEGKTPILFRSIHDVGKTAGPTSADDGYYSSLRTGSNAMNLLSLSNLCSRDEKEREQRDVTVEQKLEEEYFRRKHCENVIRKLQSTVLKQQQKLAIAINVDKTKDHTILELQTAWKRLINHWQELEEQRHSISTRYSKEKERHQKTVIDMLQKVKQCELELSKALDLAKGYKEKNEVMEQKMKEQDNFYAKEKNIMQTSMLEGQKRFLEAEEKLGILQREDSEIKEKLEAAEKQTCNEKEFALKTQEEMRNIQKLLGNLEADISIVKEENSSLSQCLKEERARNDVADQQIKSLKIALDESRRNKKLLQTELKSRTSILEKTKVDLQNYYQHQVELVVQEKLVEFQTQLDVAEASLCQEIEQKEKLALDAASKQIKHITEKNLLEVKLLEEKHREELNLYKLQIAQAIQHTNQLQAQLQSHNNRKVEIVEKLHTIMETQWQEALRIISGSSPVQPNQVEQDVVMLLSRPPLNQETSIGKSSFVETPVAEGKTVQQWANIMVNQETECNPVKMYSIISEDTKCIHAHSNNESNKQHKPPWK